MTTQKYDYHCGRCGGLVAEPMKAYGYSGQFCHCPEPTPAVFTPQQFMTTHEDIQQQVETDKNADYQKATQTEEWEKEFDESFDFLEDAIDFYYKVDSYPDIVNSGKDHLTHIKNFIRTLLSQERTRLKEEIEKIQPGIATWTGEDVSRYDLAIWEVYQYALSKINK